jgi:hypothetical protein
MNKAVGADPSFLWRYLARECEQVWADMQALGPAVGVEPLYSDALAMARETMRRVRHNIETLIPRLTAASYAFGYDWHLGRTTPEGLRWVR